MKASFKQIGQNIIFTVDGEKHTSRIVDKKERDEKVAKCTELFEKLQNSKSERTIKTLKNKIVAIIESEEVKGIKKEEEKLKAKTKGKIKQIKKKIKETAKDVSMSKYKKILPQDIFEYEKGNFYVRPFKIELPKLLVEKFVAFIKAKQDIEPLLKFWYKCLLNPNHVARTKLFDYLMKHNLIITPHGNFVTYRMVKDCDYSGKKLPSGVYTDAHTRKMRYEVGQIARLDRATECDEDGSRDCSRGLHTGSPDFIGIKVPTSSEGLGDGYNKGVHKTKSQGGGQGTGYDSAPSQISFNNSFGNVAMICLVDPQHVVSIPHSDTRKMRSCELYFAKVTTPEEVMNHLTSNDYFLYDSQYAAVKEYELKQLLKDKKLQRYIDETGEGKEITNKQLENLKAKLESLKVNNDVISSDLKPEEVKLIIEKRMIKI